MIRGLSASLVFVTLAIAACGASHGPDAGAPEDAGSPCEDGQLVACFDGPAGTLGVGPCVEGVRACADGTFGPCEGQVLPAEESCNARDDDCDGTTDDEPVLACGDCDPSCAVVGYGPSEDRPFDHGTARSDGATLGADGRLAPGGPVAPRDVLWAPAKSYTFARVDTLAREVVGVHLASFDASNVQPLVAAVDYEGNAYFGNGGSGRQTSVTKALYACIDADRDGEVLTSHGPGEILEFGDDECVAWRADLACEGFGACDEARTVAYEMRVEDDVIAERLWVGLGAELRELDAQTGEETGESARCGFCSSNGAAVDRDGFLWIDCGNSLCRFETRDPGAVEEFVRPDRSSQDLTLDPDGRPWTAGYIASFDPAAEEWTDFGDTFGHGVTATADGDVYVGACPLGDVSGSFCRVDGESLEVEVISGDLRALAADSRGLVWGFRGGAWVYDPGTGALDPVLDCAGDPCVGGPFHQSDFTGTQLMQSTDPPGTWKAVMEGCAAGETTTWLRLDWEADLPEGAAIRFEARAANDPEALSARVWTPVASAPRDAAPAPLGDLDADRNGLLLEIRATLAREPGSAPATLTAVRVHRGCE